MSGTTVDRGPPPTRNHPLKRASPHRAGMVPDEPYNGVACFIFGEGTIADPPLLFFLAAEVPIAAGGTLTVDTVTLMAAAATLGAVGLMEASLPSARLAGVGRVLAAA